MFSSIKSFIVGHKIIAAVLAVVVVGGGYMVVKAFGGSSSTPTYVLAKVTRGDLVTTISGTGQIEANQQIDLKFQSSGTVRSVAKAQGQSVRAGDVIASLDSRSAGVSLAQARASLASAQANYDKVINGATPTDISSSQAAVDAARQNLIGKLLEVYATVDNQMRTTADQFFFSPKSDTPQFGINYTTGGNTVVFTIDDVNLKIKVSGEHGQANRVLKSWQNSLAKLSLSTTDIDAYITEANANIAFFAQYFNNLTTAVYQISETTQYPTVVSGYKSDVGSARSTITTTATSLASSEASYTSAKIALTQKTAPARSEDVETARASLESANASYQNALLTYDNTLLKAPFDGQIGTLDIKVGEQASSGTAVGTLITQENYAQISLNEVDVAKVKVNDTAEITFDALSDLKIKGHVAEVDSVGAITSGVVNYGVKVALDSQDDRIKPGMSVSVVITASSKQGALVVPNSAVKSDTRGSYVQVLPGVATTGPVTTKTAPVSKAVTTGVSNDTSTEITSGLSEGDIIIIRTTTNGKTTATTRTSSTNNRQFGGGAAVGGAPSSGSRTNSR